MTLTLIEIEREHPVGSLRQPDGVFPFKEKNMAQIIINRSESRCGNCGKSAFMEEGGHYTIAGYKDNGLPGCGEEWDSVSSDYPTIPGLLVAVAKATGLLRICVGFLFMMQHTQSRLEFMVARQERMRKCQRCGVRRISPFLKTTTCGDCQALEIIEGIRNGGLVQGPQCESGRSE